MRRPFIVLAIAAVLVAAGCSPVAESGAGGGGSDTNSVTNNNNNDGTGTNDGTEPYLPECPDEDGDGICDQDEGRAEGRDTDGDGVPDYLDDDSDGDGIPDSVEVEYDPSTDELVDTDGDGTPDPYDTDADGDGIEDGTEGSADVDGDGRPNFKDTDSDGDGIGDLYEGADDADNDGQPNYLDHDSDNDTIPDDVESGTGGDPTVMPVDTDWDGVPDFLDTDSDNNGINDGLEGSADTDGDGYPDNQDIDDDGDYLPDEMEMGPDPSNPRDTDGDGVPDYRDTDSDNDGIPDSVEGIDDPDGDGIPNYMDTDSDGDGIPDSVEARTNAQGDPADTDGDFIPDYLDTDSDNDGLSDGEEDANHNGQLDPGETSPLSADTDGDGVSDLIEDAAGTDPQDPNDNPQAGGNFVFMEPYQDAPDPPEDILDFATNFQNLDLMITEDISGSMSDEVNSIRNALMSMLDDIICDPGEDPRVTGCVPSVESGVAVFGGRYTDNGLNIYCDGNSSVTDARCVIKPINSNNASTQQYLPSSVGGGSEYGIGTVWATVNNSCGTPGRIGRGCYRPDALKVAVLVTDETLQQGGYYQTSPYFNEIYNAGVKIVLVYSGGTSIATEGANMTTSSGDLLVPVLNQGALQNISQCNGANIYRDSSSRYRAIIYGKDAAAAQAMTCAVKAVAAYMPQDVEAWILNDPNNVDYFGNGVDAPSAFVDYIEVFMPGTQQCPSGYNTVDLDNDGHDDAFRDVLPGNTVCWKIHVKQNNTVPPAPDPQMFRATVEVHGAGGALLDSRDVYFLVPPENTDEQ